MSTLLPFDNVNTKFITSHKGHESRPEISKCIEIIRVIVIFSHFMIQLCPSTGNLQMVDTHRQIVFDKVHDGTSISAVIHLITSFNSTIVIFLVRC